MEFRLLHRDEPRKPGQVRILPLVKGQTIGATDDEAQLLEGLYQKKVFTGAKDDVYMTRLKMQGVYQQVVFVGLGEEDKIDLAKAIGAGIKQAAREKVDNVEVILPSFLCHEKALSEVVHACVLADYRFEGYKTHQENSPPALKLVRLVMDDLLEEAAQVVEESLVIAEQINWARDLVNQPANHQSPESLGKIAQKMDQTYEEIEVEVLKEKKIEALGMQAFLAVAEAAKNPPRLIVVRYRGNPDREGFALGIAGKGITYDTGGLSLKPSQHMTTMKTDMAGGAATLAALEALARNRVRVNVVGVIAACENAIGGGNYRPGDIITSMSGKTIYVANTDAEGRLTLADALTYLQEVEKPERLVDIATLTGAAEVALGDQVIMALSTDDEFYQLMEEGLVGKLDLIWRLPAWDLYKKLNEATDADISNSGGRLAGAITAGLFVGAFVEDDLPWIHLDIAGPSYTEKPNSLQVKGATGCGVQTLVALASALAK